MNFEFSSEELNNKEFFLSLIRANLHSAHVKKQGFCLEQLNEEFQADKEIVIAAISNSDFAIEFANDALQEDEEILAILDNLEQMELFVYLNVHGFFNIIGASLVQNVAFQSLRQQCFKRLYT